MILSLYLENSSFKGICINDDETNCKRIEDLDYLFTTAINAGDKILKSMDIYYAEVSDDMDIPSWLYSREHSSIEMEDYKRIMSKLIEQAYLVDEDEYKRVSENIIEEVYEEPQAFISMYPEVHSKWHIENIFIWSKLHRHYLGYTNNIEEFMNGLENCFLNLYFHYSVASSLHKLTHSFSDYKTEIIHHLSALNDEFSAIFLEYEDKGYQVVSEIFSSKSNISCSPERDRTTARRRTFNFLSDDNDEIAVTCELHTKFRSFHKNKDRLYFHPGIKHIGNGKILIVHIGNHLD